MNRAATPASGLTPLGIPVYEIKNLNVRHNVPGFPRFCGGGEKYNFSFTAF